MRIPPDSGRSATLSRRARLGALAAALALGAFSLTAAAASASTPASTPAASHRQLPSPSAVKAALRRSGAAPRRSSYQSVNPPSPCYYSVWGDPHDAPELDAGSYAALFDCGSSSWSFPVTTYAGWPDSELDYYEVGIDTDGNYNTGCGGFEYAVEGIYDSGSLVAGVLSTPNCVDPPGFVGDATITRDNGSDVSLVFPNAEIGSPSAIVWGAAIEGINEPDPDLIPDSSAHGESGYTGSCTAEPFGAASSSYA